MRLEFETEWLHAPGVEDVLDARTWARLEIRAQDGRGRTHVLTRLLDQRTGEVRKGVYGPVFGLGWWLVHNYWFLLHEIPLTSRPESSRRLGQIPALRAWVQRHSLLAAREGTSLPDLTFACGDGGVMLFSAQDPESVNGATRPVQFMTDGLLTLGPEVVHEGIRLFIDGLAERLRGVDHADARRLLDDWHAVLASQDAEADLCRWAAKVGLDPYDDDDLPDELADYLLNHLSRLSEPLRLDMLDALLGGASPRIGVEWVERESRTLAAIPSRPGGEVSSRSKADDGCSAHEAGYLRANALRQDLGLHPEEDVVMAVSDRWGYGLGSERRPAGEPPREWNGLIGGLQGAPVIVGPQLSQTGSVFRWARALYFWCGDQLSEGPRLLTRSHARPQRESRAFAAELLAPAAAIRPLLSGFSVGSSELNDLAGKFRVSPEVIRHQIQNHDLGVVE